MLPILSHLAPGKHAMCLSTSVCFMCCIYAGVDMLSFKIYLLLSSFWLLWQKKEHFNFLSICVCPTIYVRTFNVDNSRYLHLGVHSLSTRLASQQLQEDHRKLVAPLLPSGCHVSPPSWWRWPLSNLSSSNLEGYFPTVGESHVVLSVHANWVTFLLLPSWSDINVICMN